MFQTLSSLPIITLVH